MNLEIKWSERGNGHSYKSFQEFVQKMANRCAFGFHRYGGPKQEQRYMSRLKEELKAYRRSGNMEQLLNIAVYAWLESQTPENPRFHFDSSAPSATRHKYGGDKNV